MSIRVLLLTGIALLLVVGLILFGRDLDDAARRGPRWKRRLVAMGLAALAALGFGPACRSRKAAPSSGSPGAGQGSSRPRGAPETRTRNANRPRSGRPGSQLKDPPAQVRDWKDLRRVYHAAARVAQAPPGSYPFDEATKKRLLAGLEQARRLARRLVQSGRLSPAEGKVVLAELESLAQAVRSYRPVEMKRLSCYFRRGLPPKVARRGRLRSRLELLRKLARQGTVREEVLRLVEGRLQADLAAEEADPEPNSGQDLVAKLRRLWARLQKKARRTRP